MVTCLPSTCHRPTLSSGSQVPRPRQDGQVPRRRTHPKADTGRPFCPCRREGRRRQRQRREGKQSRGEQRVIPPPCAALNGCSARRRHWVEGAVPGYGMAEAGRVPNTGRGRGRQVSLWRLHSLCLAGAGLVLGLVLVLQCGAYGNPGCPTAQRFRSGIRL